jgi:hypothetical protein
MNYSDAFENFWVKYGSDEGLSVSEKGSKREAYKAWDKALAKWQRDENVPASEAEQEFARKIAHGYGIASRNRKALMRSKRFCPRLPMASTYLHQWRWEDALDVGTSEIAESNAPAIMRTCDRPGCQAPPIGRTAEGGWICKAHDLEDWYRNVRLSVDPIRIKWSPRLMQERYPRAQNESWPDWSRRVAREIVRNAKPGSALAALGSRGGRQEDVRDISG